jgi:predicted amidohydrolase
MHTPSCETHHAHTVCISQGGTPTHHSPAYDMPTTMSKMLAVGMPLEGV